jgi:hypothetical protein
VLRALLAAIACLCLTACWVSDTRFFGSGDWAKLDLSGDYDVARITDNDEPDLATLTPRPDGLVEFMPQSQVARGTPTLFGFVSIAGGSGRYFLAVDRSSAEIELNDGDMYYIAELTNDGGMAFYFPDCDGTPPTDGMVAEASEFNEAKTCTFSNREALMEAALAAERFLSTDHIVTVAPFMAFSKVDSQNDE